MSQVQETRKPNRFRITSIIIVVVLIFTFIPFATLDDADAISPNAIFPIGTTTIFMTDGTQNHTMTNVTADGYATQAFPAQTNVTNVFLSYVNFTITVSIEKYYEFQLWTGDLGAETNASRVMMKLGDKVIGNKIFNSTGSGNANSFVGLSQNITIGEVRIMPGTYFLLLINMINQTSGNYQPSENYIGIHIIPQTRLVYEQEFSFAFVADPHYCKWTDSVTSIDGNILMRGHSDAINKAWVAQINKMTPKPAFVILLGDILEGSYTNSAVDLRGVLDNLTIPYYLALGNHDYENGTHGQKKNVDLYQNFTDLFPEWTATHTYYYRDIAGTRFVFLDSQDQASGTISGAQQNWLNSTLNTQLPVFICQHFPLVDGSFQKLTNSAQILTILNAHDNVIADFSGHGHNEWIAHSGNILYVETPSIIQYPFFFTTVDWYRGSGIYTGDALDVNRVQLNYEANATINAWLHASSQATNTSLGIGDTVYVQYLATLALTQVGSLVHLIFIIFAVGVVVGVIAEGTHSLRRKEMPTTEQMMKMLVSRVIYIIIGMASLGVIYSIVA